MIVLVPLVPPVPIAMDDADDFLAQQRAKLAGLGAAAAQAEANTGLAINLRDRMDELDRMSKAALRPAAPVVTEMTSAELAKSGCEAPPPERTAHKTQHAAQHTPIVAVCTLGAQLALRE